MEFTKRMFSMLSDDKITIGDLRTVIASERTRILQKLSKERVKREAPNTDQTPGPLWPPWVGRRYWPVPRIHQLWCRGCNVEIELALTKGDPLDAHLSICCGAKLMQKARSVPTVSLRRTRTQKADLVTALMEKRGVTLDQLVEMLS